MLLGILSRTVIIDCLFLAQTFCGFCFVRLKTSLHHIPSKRQALPSDSRLQSAGVIRNSVNDPNACLARTGGSDLGVCVVNLSDLSPGDWCSVAALLRETHVTTTIEVAMLATKITIVTGWDYGFNVLARKLTRL